MKRMNYKYMLFLSLFLLLSCGAHQTKNTSVMKKAEPQSELNNTSTNNDTKPSHLTQCLRDLESLRTVNASQYRLYQVEYDALIKSSTDFLTVKEDISPEVAAMARPRFQFALVNLCYRIKDSLAQTFINQAGGKE